MLEPALDDDTGSEVSTNPAETESPHDAPPAGDASFGVGRLVAGKFEVLRRLGDGSFGAVYQVRHVHRRKCYALKTPRAALVADPAFQVRFEREIEAMERFVHPGAVMVRDSGVTEEGVPYYTMDYIDGEDLGTVLAREGPLSSPRVVEIARNVLSVLEAAHASDVVHRDIKPANILVSERGGREAVFVSDFGVAKLIDLAGDSGPATNGARPGTPRYMSPEQVLGREVGPASDLFSLGVVLFELLTARHPFSESRDAAEVTRAIVREPPLDLRELAPGVPSELAATIARFLAKEIEERPRSAREGIDLLRGLTGSTSYQPLRRLEVCAGIARREVGRLVLTSDESRGERRSFLFFQDELSFGRANQPERGVVNDCILRALPCRSSVLDPVEWSKNVTISQRSGRIVIDGAAVLLEPAAGRGRGIAVDGVGVGEPVRLHAERFHLTIGERALELDARILLARSDVVRRELSGLGEGLSRTVESARIDRATEDAAAAGEVREPAAGPAEPARRAPRAGDRFDLARLDAVRLSRADNWHLHEYFLVSEQLEIGSGIGAGLRVADRRLALRHALILRHGGEGFIASLEGEVLVRGAIDRPQARGLLSCEVPGAFRLEDGYALPLIPGLELLLGDAKLRVEFVTDAHFKTV